MTTAQNRMYWGEWAAVKQTIAKRGIVGTAVEELRHKLHVRALGHDKSSSKLTNSELDRVLAAFRAESKPADFAAQMAVQDSPDVRRNDLLTRIDDALRVILPAAEYAARMRYLSGTAKRICREADVEQLTERDLQKIMGALERSARVKDKAASTKAVAATEAISPF